MRYNNQMIGLNNHPKYPYAKKILNNILNKENPDLESLMNIHDSDIAYVIKNVILNFYNDKGFTGGTVRSHENAPTLLSDSRKLADLDFDFQAIESVITRVNPNDFDKNVNELEKEIKIKIGPNIKNKYGDYSPNIIKALALSKTSCLKRKSGISKAAHWIGVSSYIHFLESNEIIPPHPVKNYRISVAFMHDLLEDLKDSEHILPKEENFVRDVNLLTNPYTIISKQAYFDLKSRKRDFNKNTFKNYLKEYTDSCNDKTESKYKLYKNIEHLLMEDRFSKVEDIKLLESVSWRTYELYVNRIWRKSLQSEDDTPIITKFCDQSYNFIGKSKLSDGELNKNMLKMWLWSSTIYSSAINIPHVNNFVMELLEDALCYSEYLVLRDIIYGEAPIAHYESAFKNIKELSPIFYKDKKLV